jgi:hypothetical protein
MGLMTTQEMFRDLWCEQEEIRETASKIRKLIGEMRELEDEEGDRVAAVNFPEVGHALAGLAAELRCRDSGGIAGSSDWSSVECNLAGREEKSALDRTRLETEDELRLIVELLCRSNGPDTSWREVERRYLQCQATLLGYLAHELDFVRRQTLSRRPWMANT